MMIHASDYEPQDQDQRFETQEQGRHIHIYFHLNLTFQASQDHLTYPNAISVLRIFAALIGAMVMNLVTFFFISLTLHDPSQDGRFITLNNIAWAVLFAGLALTWCAAGPLLLDVWRSKPLLRFGFLLTLVLLLSIPLFLLNLLNGHWFGTFLDPLWIMYPFLLIFSLSLLLLPFLPLNTALLLAFLSREAHALRQETTAYTRLSFVMVSGMVLIVLSGLLLNLLFMLGGSPLLLLFFLPFMCAAVIVTIRSLFKLHKSTQANPKDASPFERNSSQKPHEYRG